MTILKIDRSRGGWESVPRRLFDDGRLSLDTRGVAGFLATRTDGFELKVSGLKHLLQLGKEKWERIAAELKAAGYLSQTQGRHEDGRWHWELVFSPEPDGGWPEPPQAGNPPVAEPRVAEPPVYKRLDKQETGITRAAAGAGVAAAPVVQEKKRFRLVHGVHCWERDEPSQVQQLIDVHGLQKVQAAVSELSAKGVEPFFSRVDKKLREMHRAALASAATARHEAFKAAQTTSRPDAPPSPEFFSSTLGKKVTGLRQKIRP